MSHAPDRSPRREDMEFMPVGAAALFQQPSKAGAGVLYAFAGLMLTGLVWSSVARLDEITVAEGKVIPSSQVQVIQNLEGGIVSRIPVQVGDVVKKGQVILNLDDTRFSSSLSEAEVKKDALSAKVARLTAEAAGQPFVPPPELVKRNPKVVEEEKLFYQSRQRELETTLSVLRQQAAQRAQELTEMRSKVAQLEESLKLATDELKMSKPMADQGVMAPVDFLRLQRQVNDLTGELNTAKLSIPRIQGSMGEANSKIESALAKFRSDAAAELAQARPDLAGTNASSVALQDRYQRTTVRAPLTGIVKQIKVTTVGGVIQPGMDVMEIVPLEDNLLVEAKVRPSDVGFLRPGQQAMVKLTAYDFSIYGGLDAVVENITADSLTNDKGESFYLVRVRTKKNHLGSDGKPLPIIPGMLATVHIKTGQKTVLQYLLKPVIKAKQEAMRER